MRFAIACTAMLCLATGCRDDNRQSSVFVTDTPRPSLTMRTLPQSASTICVANVRQRDQLLAQPQTAAMSRQVIALGAVIDDVCN